MTASSIIKTKTKSFLPWTNKRAVELPYKLYWTLAVAELQRLTPGDQVLHCTNLTTARTTNNIIYIEHTNNHNTRKTILLMLILLWLWKWEVAPTWELKITTLHILYILLTASLGKRY